MGEINPYEEEYLMLQDLERNTIVTESNRDLTIVIEVPPELLVLLGELKNDMVGYDVLEYGLRGCTEIIKSNSIRTFNFRYVKEKMSFYISKLTESKHREILYSHIDTLSYSIQYLCSEYVRVCKKHDIDFVFWITVDRDEFLNRELSLSILIDPEVETP